MLRFIIKEKYIKMINFIDKKSPSIRDISKHTGANYLQVKKVVEQLAKEEILIKELSAGKGAPYKITLTNKGKSINKLLILIYQIHKNVYRGDINKINIEI